MSVITELRPSAATPGSVGSAPKAARAVPDTNILIPYLFAAWSFALTFVVAPYYTGGDQLYYRAFYETRSGSSFADSFVDYQAILGSNEPGYFLVVMAFSRWLDKDALMAMMNALLGYFLGQGLVKINASRFVILLLAGNYYLYVMYFAADRLKLAVLFLLLAMAKPRYARLAYFAAIISHLQSIVLLVGRLLGEGIRNLWPLLRGRLRRDAMWAPLVILILTVPVYFLRDYAVNKLEVYTWVASQGSVSLLKPAAMLAITLFYAPGRRIEAASMHLPIMVVSSLVGVERLVLFGYGIFMYYGLQVRRGLNFGVLMSSLYFAITGVVFIFDVVNYGTGYYWTTPPIMRIFG
jgi:hypothetical protein